MTINMRHSRLWINIEPNVHADSHMFSREIHPQPHSSYGTLTDETPAGGDSSNAIQEPSPLEGEGQGEGVWACPRLGRGGKGVGLGKAEDSGGGRIIRKK